MVRLGMNVDRKLWNSSYLREYRRFAGKHKRMGLIRQKGKKEYVQMKKMAKEREFC